MAKPTADTDKELIQQMKNLKAGLLERADELLSRGYDVDIRIKDSKDLFTLVVSKTVKSEDFV